MEKERKGIVHILKGKIQRWTQGTKLKMREVSLEVGCGK
jgi:hypothetical protein